MVANIMEKHRLMTLGLQFHTVSNNEINQILLIIRRGTLQVKCFFLIEGGEQYTEIYMKNLKFQNKVYFLQ